MARQTKKPAKKATSKKTTRKTTAKAASGPQAVFSVPEGGVYYNPRSGGYTIEGGARLNRSGGESWDIAPPRPVASPRPATSAASVASSADPRCSCKRGKNGRYYCFRTEYRSHRKNLISCRVPAEYKKR